eukprot:3940453-Rhodomonas_salina.3
MQWRTGYSVGSSIHPVTGTRRGMLPGWRGCGLETGTPAEGLAAGWKLWTARPKDRSPELPKRMVLAFLLPTLMLEAPLRQRQLPASQISVEPL